MNNIAHVFPLCQVNNCLQQVRGTFIVHDPLSGKCVVHPASTPPPHPYVTVHNSNSRCANFLAIDACILFAADGEKCDCAVFDNSLCCFIEIKAATGTHKSEKKKDALDQLYATITAFIAAGIDFSHHKLVALRNVGFQVCRPTAQATLGHQRLLFVNKFNAFLEDGNFIDFN